MKVTVNFGRTGVVVPCKDTWKVQDLINQATQRYRRLLEQGGEFVVRTHHVEYADGGILDPDDMLTDLLEDRDKLVAVYEEKELQSSRSRAISPGGSVASGYSSPYTSEPELGLLRPAVSTEIEVTPRTLKSNTPLLVRSSSEMILPRSTDFLTQEPDTSNSRSTPTGGGVRVIGHGLTVKPVTMDPPKQDLQTSRTTRDPNNTFSNSGLTRTVQLTGVTTGPLGIKVVPYCSSLSGRTLGLHIKSIEEKSRTKEEGIFEEDECIVQINDTPLIDKSFSESQEIFRQAMSSTLVQLEVLLVSNRLQYEKSLIGQIFTGSDLHPNAPPKPRSPFLLRTTDPASTSPTPLLREGQPVRQSPVQTERREETPSPPVRASPTPRSQSESPASVRSSTLTVLANAVNKKGSRKRIDLNKGPDGLGFTVVTRDSSVHGTGPILVKSILPRGAAIRDGRLQSGDRLLEVNGVDVSTFRQEDLVAMLRRTKQGQTISLLVSRPEEPFLPRELKGEALGPPLPEDGRDQLTFEIPVNDSGSAGLGVSLKGNKSRETGEDLGIFIKSIIHGGAAFKDGRLWVNDQLLAVNGESLVGRSNHDAMETLRRSMSMEGNLRGTIQLVILRAQQEGSPSREGSPFQNSRTDGVSLPPMVNNSIYQHVPASNGRPRAYEDAFDDDFPSPPSDLETMESDFNKGPSQNRAKREPVLVASRPMTSKGTPKGPEFYINRASKSMDLVPDESNFGSMESQRPAPSYSVGPTLGLQKSSSLESLQTAMEEASKPEVPFHRPVGPMVRGRGCNMSFRQAIDKSYDGLSEPEEDYSEESSGRDTPASSSSRQELDDGAKEKKKKTKKKKEKKSKAKKKDDGDDSEKKTKKKGFALLRFGKKNKEDKAKAKLGSLSEEELDKTEAEAFSYGTDVDRSLPNRIEVEDDDYDPNYARINNFRDPSEKTLNPSHMSTPNYGPPPGPIQNISGPKEDPREGLYAKVSKLKPASQQPANSNDARLQQIRSQLQYLKPAVPLHPEPGAAPRLQEYDPSRIRGPDPRMAPKYEDRQYASVPRRSPAQIHQPHSGPQQPSSLPRSGPYRYDLPPSPHLGQRGAPSYESATRGRTPDPDQYRASGDGQYPKYSHKNATIGAV